MGISVGDYLSMQARLGAASRGSSISACEDEGQLHDDILCECRRRGWLCLHGSMAHRTKRTPGEFDFIILADSGRTLFVECKKRGGKLSPEQRAIHAHAQHLGHTTHVVYSFEEFLQICSIIKS